MIKQINCKMEYNICKTCGAKNGRAGLLISTDLNDHAS